MVGRARAIQDYRKTNKKKRLSSLEASMYAYRRANRDYLYGFEGYDAYAEDVAKARKVVDGIIALGLDPATVEAAATTVVQQENGLTKTEAKKVVDDAMNVDE